MSDVRIDEPSRMNILGLFLATTLRYNLVEKGLPCRLRGTLTVEADGMRASVRFGPDGAVVTREEGGAKVSLRAPLHRFVNAMVRPGLRAFLRIRVRGNPLFALKAMRYLRP